MKDRLNTYVALLRGINVGGKNRVEMPRLKVVFEKIGFTHVKTYINSGNIIFSDGLHSPGDLAALIEQAIHTQFGFAVKVLVRSYENIDTIVKALPAEWQNDQTMKCDVMFLWEHVDDPKLVDQLTIKPELEDVKYAAGALLWRVDRQHVTKSDLLKVVGTPLYKNMTIRNCNTLRKLHKLMKVT